MRASISGRLISMVISWPSKSRSRSTLPPDWASVNRFNHELVAAETRQAAPLLGDLRNRLFRRWLLLQPLQHGGYDQRQTYCSVHKHFPKLPTFSRRYELAPRHRLAVGTARKSAPVDRFGADAQSVVITLQRQGFPAPAGAQFDERPELLRPVARNASANGEDSQPLLAEQGCGEVLQVFEGIETEARLPL